MCKMYTPTGNRIIRNIICFILLLCMVFAFAGCEQIIIYQEPVQEPVIKEVDLNSGEFIVTYIDVGQGDSALLERNGHYMLIDGGDVQTREQLVQFLTDYGVTELDYVVGTHPHNDHIGGLDMVVKEFDVKTILMPKAVSTTKAFERLTEAIRQKGLKIKAPVPGDEFILGDDVRISTLSPQPGEYEDVNNYSIVFLVEFGNTRFMFTGDAEKLVEDEILAHGDDIRADVLYLGHHGSNTSTSGAFLQAVSPSIGVISCGKDNSYNHPHEKVVNRLTDAGVEIYRTDIDGTITVVSDGSDIWVSD